MISLSWKYLAGFFDGEGHVRCDVRGYKGRKYIAPQVFLSQAYPQHDVLYEIQSFLLSKGIPSKVSKTKGKGNRNDCYRLVVTSQSACRDFLYGVLPYLIVKDDAAREVLAKVEGRIEIRSKPGWSPRKRLHSDKEAAQMLDMHLEGMSQEAIAQEFKTHQVAVSRAIRRAARLEIAV